MKQIVVTRKISSQLIEWLACVAGNRIHELVIFGVTNPLGALLLMFMA